MNARFGHTELPDEQAKTLHRAIRLETITLAIMTVTLILVILVAGSSQAMKAAWVEDALSLLPPLAFLIAVRFIRRRPTARHPYGYHRSIGVAHLVAAVAPLAMGAYLIIDSAVGLFAAEHPPIGVIEIFGTPIWLGWLMILVMTTTAVPPVIFGRLKLKLAPVLHDKVLYADAQMNKADWMTSLATVVGVLGIGVGLWWADAVAAIFISFSIVSDGWKNLRGSISDLMDARATEYDGTDPDPITHEIVETLLVADWITEADCRVRDQGHVLHVEAFIVPADGVVPSLGALARARERCVEIDWRIQDIVVVPVEALPEEFLPHLTEEGSNG